MSIFSISAHADLECNISLHELTSGNILNSRTIIQNTNGITTGTMDGRDFYIESFKNDFYVRKFHHLLYHFGNFWIPDQTPAHFNSIDNLSQINMAS